jgi:hypothetical protein
MIITTTPTSHSKLFPATGQAIRLISAIFMVSSLVACATAPTPQAATQSTVRAQDSTGISSAAAMYNTNNYPGAIREFDAIIASGTSSANSRRLAHLGKAMVYLGKVESWHSIENAKMSLMSAGRVAPEDGEEFAVETDMLMDAVSSVIGTESKYTVLMAKSSGFGQQNAELRRELDALKTEREELLKNQKMLNDALEKLKELTLGN